MSIYIADLYQDTRTQYLLNWIAGKKGQRNIVNWIYVAEDMDNAQFLHGGELIISTGFASAQIDNWLYTFISALIQKRTCGLILNIGKYITPEDISQEVIDLCNTHSFPLLTMPWEVHLSDLSQNFCNRIFADRQKTFNLSNALTAYLQNETIKPHTRSMLNDLSYLEQDTYCLALLQIQASEDTLLELLHNAQKLTHHCPSSPKTDFIAFEYRRHLVLIWHKLSQKVIQQHLQEFLNICRATHGMTQAYIGVSQNDGTLNHLSQLYQQADAALHMAPQQPNHLMYYRDLGCYQLFHHVSDPEILQQYYRQYLWPLEDYDQHHNSAYLETLENYLKYNGHLAAIADAMICHKNTINYRINKIRELLNVDLNDGEVKFQLQLAINIRNYLKLFA